MPHVTTPLLAVDAVSTGNVFRGAYVYTDKPVHGLISDRSRPDHARPSKSAANAVESTSRHCRNGVRPASCHDFPDSTE